MRIYGTWNSTYRFIRAYSWKTVFIFENRTAWGSMWRHQHNHLKTSFINAASCVIPDVRRVLRCTKLRCTIIFLLLQNLWDSWMRKWRTRNSTTITFLLRMQCGVVETGWSHMPLTYGSISEQESKNSLWIRSLLNSVSDNDENWRGKVKTIIVVKAGYRQLFKPSHLSYKCVEDQSEEKL